MKTFLWCVRRELWEHGWVWRAPVLIGAVTLVITSAAVSTAGSGDPDPATTAFDVATRVVLVTGTLVGFLYCAEALNSERRDRSILFWKSLPISDATAVAAKAAIPILVISVITLVSLLTLAVGIRGMIGPQRAAALPTLARLDGAALEVLASALWLAPMYAWILLVSAWARRAVLLVAVLPPVLAGMVETMVTGNDLLGAALFQRGVGRHWPVTAGPISASADAMLSTPPSALLGSSSMWVGVMLALGLLIASTRLRHAALD